MGGGCTLYRAIVPHFIKHISIELGILKNVPIKSFRFTYANVKRQGEKCFPIQGRAAGHLKKTHLCFVFISTPPPKKKSIQSLIPYNTNFLNIYFLTTYLMQMRNWLEEENA